MNILVIGGGGREHALAWKLAQSHKVQAIYVAPGNAGTARDKRLQNVPITDIHQLCAFAAEKISVSPWSVQKLRWRLAWSMYFATKAYEFLGLPKRLRS